MKKYTMEIGKLKKGKKQIFPACVDCWNEAADSEKIEILVSRPILKGS